MLAGVSRDPGNARYAVQAAYWVFVVSGADGGPTLASILNRCRCWAVAERSLPSQPGDGQRAWWQRSVLPGREERRAEPDDAREWPLASESDG